MTDTPTPDSSNTTPDEPTRDWQVQVVHTDEKAKTPPKKKVTTGPRPRTAPSATSPSAPGKTAKLVVTILLVVGLAGLVIGILTSKHVRHGRRSATEANIVTDTPTAAPTQAPRPPAVAAPSAATPRHATASTYKGIVTGTGKKGDGKVIWRGKTVYITGAKEGDEVTFRVTSEKDSFAFGELVSSRTPATSTPGAAAPATALAASGVLRGTVEGLGKKGDGRVKVNGKTVYVPGTKVGQSISFRIVDDRGAYAIGALVSSDAPAPAGDAPAAIAPVPGVARNAADCSSDDVQVGAVFDVEITEKERRNPDVNGVTRIGGLVVIVPNSQPGDKVRVKINRRLERIAFSDKAE